MNEKMLELLDFVCVDPEQLQTGMTTDDILEHLGCTVDVDGEILDADENPTGIWYDEIK